MPKQSPSFFHKVNNDLTVNLASVYFVAGRTGHYESLLSGQERQWAQNVLDSGKVCRLTLRSEDSDGLTVMITREEMTKLQDALNWYNRHVVAPE